jgi:hypothetical protein
MLILKPIGGLGNRIRSIVAGKRIAKHLGIPFGIIWSMDTYHCFCRYERLFSTPQCFLTEECLYQTPFLHYSPSKSPTRIPLKKLTYFVAEENFFYLDSDENVIWGAKDPYRARNPVLAGELQEQFDSLIPSKKIKERVDSFPLGNCIGVHIRREDNRYSNLYCHDNEFKNAIDDVLSHMDLPIFLVTDGIESRNFIRREYPNRVIEYPTRSFSRGSSEEAIEDALIQILLLARTSVIVRSNSSTFSQVASWFGRVPTVDVGLPEHDY